MRTRRTLLTRAATYLTTLGVALSGAAVLSSVPAQAEGLRETDFAFRTTAYGTRVTATDVQLRSSRTAFSYLSCTRLAGLRDDAYIAAVNAPGDNPSIHVGAVESDNETYRLPKKGVVGVLGHNRIAKVTLGPDGGPQLIIENLRTTAHAWHTKGKGFQAETVVDSLPITPVQIVPEEAPPELREGLELLLDGVSDGVQGVFDAIRENAGPIEIPGLGNIHMGYERTAVKKRFAAASAYVLKIDLYGQDTVKGGGDDSQVALGRAWARIDKDVPAGVFHGVGYGAQINALDSVLNVGRVATRALPCPGTNGKIRTSNLAGLNLGGQDSFEIEGLGGRSFGVQHDNGRAKGWTEGHVAEINLGDGALVLKGIQATARVSQDRSGKPKVSHDVVFGSIFADGKEQGGLPTEPVEIPGGVAIVEGNVVTKQTKRAIAVTAVRITLFPDTPGETVIKLGNAHVRLTRV